MEKLLKLHLSGNGFLDLLSDNKVNTSLCTVSKEQYGKIKVTPSESISTLNSLLDKKTFKGYFIDFLNDRILEDLKFLSEMKNGAKD